MSVTQQQTAQYPLGAEQKLQLENQLEAGLSSATLAIEEFKTMPVVAAARPAPPR